MPGIVNCLTPVVRTMDEVTLSASGLWYTCDVSAFGRRVAVANDGAHDTLESAAFLFLKSKKV